MSSENIVDMKNIALSYSGNRILEYISFSIRRNEIHVLLGQNGTGKTSIVKILAGELTPDSGEIRFHGKLLNGKCSLSNIHVIRQNICLFPNLTVIENIFFENKELFHFGRYSIDMYNELAARLKIHICPYRYVRELSASEKRLTEIMRAVIRKTR